MESDDMLVPIRETQARAYTRPRHGRWRASGLRVEAVRVAVAAILAHRLRSGLTVLGVVIGVAVVSLVAALLEGAQRYIGQQAEELGPGIVRVDKAAFQDFIGDGQAFVEARAKRPDLTLDEVRGLRARLAGQLLVGAQVDAALPVRRGARQLAGIAIQGVTPNITTLSSMKIERGRELTELDDEYRRPVCVIGADVADYLFPDRDPVGEMLKAGTAQYEIVG
ncbi:MAG: ABC transporter permease, partial [Blastocatellia bacterium]